MKTVKLSEESYNKLKDRLINEISYGTVDHAYDRANDLFWEVRSTFEDFYSALDDAMFKAKYDKAQKELKKKDVRKITLTEEQSRLLSSLFPDIDSLL